MKIIFILLLLAGLVVAVIIAQGRQYQAFLDKAGKVTGTLTAKEERRLRADQPTNVEHWVRYSYSVDGKQYSGEEKVEYADLWHSLQEGQGAEIYYHKGNPGKSHLALVLDRRVGIAQKLSSVEAK
jgi:hypothetical protein